MSAPMDMWNKKELIPPPTTYMDHSVNVITHDGQCYTGLQSTLQSVYNGENIVGSLLEGEHLTLSRLLYKHKNAQRSWKRYQLVMRIKKCLQRLSDIGIHSYAHTMLMCWESMRDNNNLPAISLPSRHMLEHLLVLLQGYAKLSIRIAALCEQAVVIMIQNIHQGMFLSNNLVLMAVTSRIRVLVCSLLKSAIAWYDILIPWRSVLTSTKAEWLPDGTELPLQLTEWLGDEAKILMPKKSRNLKPNILDKLFNTSQDSGRSEEGEENVDIAEYRGHITAMTECDLGERLIAADLEVIANTASQRGAASVGKTLQKRIRESGEKERRPSCDEPPSKKLRKYSRNEDGMLDIVIPGADVSLIDQRRKQKLMALTKKTISAQKCERFETKRQMKKKYDKRKRNTDLETENIRMEILHRSFDPASSQVTVHRETKVTGQKGENTLEKMKDLYPEGLDTCVMRTEILPRSCNQETSEVTLHGETKPAGQQGKKIKKKIKNVFHRSHDKDHNSLPRELGKRKGKGNKMLNNRGQRDSAQSREPHSETVNKRTKKLKKKMSLMNRVRKMKMKRQNVQFMQNKARSEGILVANDAKGGDLRQSESRKMESSHSGKKNSVVSLLSGKKSNEKANRKRQRQLEQKKQFDLVEAMTEKSFTGNRSCSSRRIVTLAGSSNCDTDNVGSSKQKKTKKLKEFEHRISRRQAKFKKSGSRNDDPVYINMSAPVPRPTKVPHFPVKAMTSESVKQQKQQSKKHKKQHFDHDTDKELDSIFASLL